MIFLPTQALFEILIMLTDVISMIDGTFYCKYIHSRAACAGHKQFKMVDKKRFCHL